MPEVMFPKLHPHPRNRGPATDASDGTDGEQRRRPDPGDRPGRPVGSRPRVQYAELAVTSNFTFLTGGSHPEEFVERAAALDHAAAAIADRNSLAGIVRAHVTAKRLGLPLAIGSRLRFTDGLTPDILVFAASRVGYANLSTLLTVGKRRAPKGECHLALHDLLAHQAGLLAVVDPPPTLGLIEHELALIAELGYAPFFLTVHDIVRFARGRGILCQGRGSAANSAVCYCLGITEVDPARMDMLFERFVSRERGEPPDIDVDFEHQRREEVIQYIYRKYGRDRAALAADRDQLPAQERRARRRQGAGHSAGSGRPPGAQHQLVGRPVGAAGAAARGRAGPVQPAGAASDAPGA
jgi:hypothetical protein